MWFLSILLFLAGAFTIYISVMLFLNKDVLWGVINMQNPISQTDHGTQYFESIFHVAFFIIGLIGIILSLLGCCTAKTRDRCSVCCFSITGFIIFVVFTGLAISVMIITNQSFAKLQDYCSGQIDPESATGLIEPLEMTLLEKAYPTVAEIDEKLIGSINRVMCKAQCPCSPKGLLNLDKFDQDLAR